MGGCAGCCFPGDVMITMADRTERRIDEIIEGDKVLSFDFDMEDFVSSPVGEIEDPIRWGRIVLEFADRDVLEMTDEHPVFTRYHGWASPFPLKTNWDSDLDVKLLEVGMEIFDDECNWHSIRNIVFKSDRFQAFNLCDVGRVHNYFANGVLVHNKGGANARAAAAAAPQEAQLKHQKEQFERYKTKFQPLETELIKKANISEGERLTASLEIVAKHIAGSDVAQTERTQRTLGRLGISGDESQALQTMNEQTSVLNDIGLSNAVREQNPDVDYAKKVQMNQIGLNMPGEVTAMNNQLISLGASQADMLRAEQSGKEAMKGSLMGLASVGAGYASRSMPANTQQVPRLDASTDADYPIA